MTSSPLRAIKQTRKAVIARDSTVYIDRGVVILNKPAGLICQLHARKYSESGVRDLGYDFNELLEGLRETHSLSERPYPVHRLDKGTTGALAVARSVSMARELSQQLQRRTVEKTYLALVRGGSKSFQARSGKIHTPIQYIDGRAALSSSYDNGKLSITEWELVDSSPNVPLSLLRFKLHTGHKHQLRVHAAHCLNAPILGDTLYSRSLPSDAIAHFVQKPGDRIFLHASKISFFRYKASGMSKRFRLGVCTPLPDDFLRICIDSGLKVPLAEAEGGVSIDGVLVSDGQVPDLQGYWVGSDTNKS